MKKISYSLRIGLIGSRNSGKELLLNYLDDIAIEKNHSDEKFEVLLVHKGIPFKINVFLAENLIEVISEQSINFGKLDVLIIILNLNDLNSIKEFEKEIFEEFRQFFLFQGLSILAGMDVEQILKGSSSNNVRISRFNLIKKAKELNILYCFEIHNKERDISEIYNKLLNDFIFKFQYSTPELFEQAKIYGRELIKLNRSFLKNLNKR
ncbi:MAG: hypothetical protein ACFFAQ_12090 [Promethearchaeota archaeon]